MSGATSSNTGPDTATLWANFLKEVGFTITSVEYLNIVGKAIISPTQLATTQSREGWNKFFKKYSIEDVESQTLIITKLESIKASYKDGSSSPDRGGTGLTWQDIEYIPDEYLSLEINGERIDLGKLQTLEDLLPVVNTFNIPKKAVFVPKNPNFIRSDLEICTSNNPNPNFLFLEGHLGDPFKVSDQVAEILTIFANDYVTGKRSAIRLRGPSGTGKSKTIIDLLRDIFGLYFDWSQTQVSDTSTFRKRAAEYRTTFADQEQYENACKYELLLLYTSRLAVLRLFFKTERLNPYLDSFGWLLLQLNGLVSGESYYQVLCPVRNFLRKQHNSTVKLEEFLRGLMSSLANKINNSPGIPNKSPILIAHDEVNTLVRELENNFWNSTKDEKWPLIAFVLRETYELEGPEVIMSGTNRIRDHYDYFGSYFLKTQRERARVSKDINL